MTINGALDGIVFTVYVEQVLCPTLIKGDVVVMDNLPSHKVSGIEKLIEARSAKLIYLPSYSPDLNPIEKCRSRLKNFLRAKAAQTYELLLEAIGAAIKQITAADAQNWIRHCGYVSQSL